MRWVAATLLALLGLAWALLSLAAPNAKVHPAPDDTGLSGLSLFAKALQDAGYRVVYDRSTRPSLGADDVAIVPILTGESAEREKAVEPAVRHVREGGRALFLGVPSELASVATGVPVANYLRRRASVNPTPSADDEALFVNDPLASVSLWHDEEGGIASLVALGKGRVAELRTGALATNRFLPRADDARVVLSTLAAVAHPGDRLVFVAGGYGDTEPLGPIEAIGPWAVGALWQSLVVLAAFGVARGVRFGLAAPDAVRKRGSRELLDALAGHYRRGRRTDAPLAAVARERPDDAEAQTLAVRTKVSEDEARRALLAIEARPSPRR